jgi:hypothetical protein
LDKTADDNKVLKRAARILSERLSHRETAIVEMRSAIDCIRQESNKTTHPHAQLAELKSAQTIRIRRDLFFGMRLSTAVQKHLQMRGEATDPDEILRALWEGGFNVVTLGSSEDQRLANLISTLWKNNKTFHRLPNGAFGLVTWYANILNATKRPKRNRSVIQRPQNWQTPAKVTALDWKNRPYLIPMAVWDDHLTPSAPI